VEKVPFFAHPVAYSFNFNSLAVSEGLCAAIGFSQSHNLKHKIIICKKMGCHIISITSLTESRDALLLMDGEVIPYNEWK